MNGIGIFDEPEVPKDVAYANVRDVVASVSGLTLVQANIVRRSLLTIARELGVDPNYNPADAQNKEEARAGKVPSEE